MIRVAIVEDDPEAAGVLEGYLSRYGREEDLALEVTRFANAVVFLERERPGFDLVWMDIELPMMNGLEAAAKLRQRDRQAVLIFVTNMAQYAVKGYEVDALDFMVKPVRYADFSFRMRRACRAIRMNRKREITIPIPGGLYRVTSDDLLYVEVLGHKSLYHLQGETVETRETLTAAQRRLENWGFLRCNSCYLVNPAHIEWVKGYVVKVGGDELQISHPKRKEFMEQLSSWYARGGI